MTTFVLRVELHGAVSEDYEQLHSSMGAAGFERTMVFGGLPYHLPTGEYRYDGNGETSIAVCQKAQAIAAAIRPSPSIVVTESASGAAVGLTPASNLGLVANALADLGRHKTRPATNLIGNALAAGLEKGSTTSSVNGLFGNALTQAAGIGLKK